MDLVDFVTYPCRWWKGGVWYKVFKPIPPVGEYEWRRRRNAKGINLKPGETIERIEVHY